MILLGNILRSGSFLFGKNVDTRVQRARHWVDRIRGFITKYKNQNFQKSEFHIALNCFNPGERKNIERPTLVRP